MHRRRMAPLGIAMIAAGLAIAALVVPGAGAAAGSTGGVDPATFTDPKPNPYFPLREGRLSVYRGTEGGDRLREHMLVTHRTKTIVGVATVVVVDVLHANGELAERTEDWYQADNDGTVWYFGEDTAEYENGHVVSREGSWQAGVDGAVAGVVMPADPRPTDAFRQEYWRGQAEDQAWIVARLSHVHVPLGAFDHVVRSFEWTRLEPRVVSVKFYAKGLGIVAERDVAGGTEHLELVDVRQI
jgi:hypothetical protein